MVRLYVGNLPYVAQPEDIEALFEASGIPILSLDISIDPFTGRNPSYCFVDIESHDASTAVDLLTGKDVRGRPVKVSSYTGRRRRSNGSTWRTSHSVQRDPTLSPPGIVFDRWRRQDAKDHWTIPCDQGRRLWVGGLPRIDDVRAVNAEMRALFAGFELQAVSKIIPTQPRPGTKFVPGHHYYCFVDVATAGMAGKAVAATNGRSTPHGGAYRVQLSRPNHATKVVREQLGGVWPGQVDTALGGTQTSPKRDLDRRWRRSALAC